MQIVATANDVNCFSIISCCYHLNIIAKQVFSIFAVVVLANFGSYAILYFLSNQLLFKSLSSWVKLTKFEMLFKKCILRCLFILLPRDSDQNANNSSLSGCRPSVYHSKIRNSAKCLSQQHS